MEFYRTGPSALAHGCFPCLAVSFFNNKMQRKRNSLNGKSSKRRVEWREKKLETKLIVVGRKSHKTRLKNCFKIVSSFFLYFRGSTSLDLFGQVFFHLLNLIANKSCPARNNWAPCLVENVKVRFYFNLHRDSLFVNNLLILIGICPTYEKRW